MGDAVLTVPVIKSFQEKYPDTKITLLTKPFFHPFFDGIPNLTLPKVALKGKHKGILGLRKLVKELTQTQQYDAVIDLHSVLRSWAVGFFFKREGTSVYRIDKVRKEKKNFLKDITKPQLPHSTERYQKVFHKAGFDFELPQHFLSPKKGEKNITEIIKISEINIGIAPFAAHKSKEWGIDKIHDLIKQINANHKVNFFLFGGGAAEVMELNLLEEDFQNVTNLAGKYSLRDEMQLISQLNVMICMDSGNMHIATLLGIPVLSIWGGTHPKVGFSALYQPYENSIQIPIQEQKKCKYTVFGTSKNQRETKPYFCIQMIDASVVVERLLGIGVL